MKMKDLMAMRMKKKKLVHDEDHYEQEDYLDKEETHSNELNDGEDETEDELEDEKKSVAYSEEVDHDEESDDEYVEMIEDMTQQDLETPVAKRLRKAFALAKMKKKMGRVA